MRMLEVHMLNGPLYPVFNLQIAVENSFLLHSFLCHDRTDYHSLIPVLDTVTAAASVVN